MGENVQATVQLHSFHMLARLCSKSFKLGFSSTWTKNFQMYKLDQEKAEESEIKLPTSAGSYKKQRNSKKNTSASLTTLKLLTVWIINNCGKFLKRWEYQTHITCLLRSLYAGQEATVRTGHGTELAQNWEKGMSRLYIVTLLI